MLNNTTGARASSAPARCFLMDHSLILSKCDLQISFLYSRLSSKVGFGKGGARAASGKKRQPLRNSLHLWPKRWTLERDGIRRGRRHWPGCAWLGAWVEGRFAQFRGGKPAATALKRELDLRFQAAIIGRLVESFAILSTCDLVGKAEIRGGDVADNRSRVGVIEQVPDGEPDAEVEAVARS